MSLQNKKIKYLVIRFSSIGDIVLTTPVVRCLKQQCQNAEIHFLVRSKYAAIVVSNPYIDKVYSYSGKCFTTVSFLKKQKFDFVIDLQNNLLSNFIKTGLRIPAFTLNKLNLLKFFLVKFKINRLPYIHIVDRYMKTLSVFDIKNDGQGLDFFIPSGQEFDRRRLPFSFDKGYVAFVIGGSYFTKRLPRDKVIDICNQLEYPVILLGGNNEVAAGEEITAGSKGNIFNLTGKTTLCESASVVRDASVVLTNDTGLMHIAAAFRKKILSFWGNTIPELGMYPYLPDISSKIMEVKNLKCRPCSKLGYTKCPKKHFRCMNS
ncbi:MAG: glycosyltransferase family 9 protein, partial [Prolixibacteraceae bacterium]|nr:glycosyltransferase family 9 protein [Prolixibacteraceae bacterium]